ncbi:hypothetical protein ACEWY4_022781 [Coilia grayii]|uniref:Par3/HAL N-terminal domain-containing protein n=1 Tax=Coilia grayii TaxID=363190 RepID=A0ABD1J4P9_9TELE
MKWLRGKLECTGELQEREGDFLVRTHHVEYCDGGILDPDDILTDLVEDRDKRREMGPCTAARPEPISTGPVLAINIPEHFSTRDPTYHRPSGHQAT